jgi:hypothetical protein
VLRARSRATRELRADIEGAFERQRRSVVARLGAKAKSGVKVEASDVFNRDRFTRELAADIKPGIKKAAKNLAATVGDWDPEEADEYLTTVSDSFAESVTDATYDRLEAALDVEDALEATDELFDNLIDTTAGLYAASLIAGVGEFARAEAARTNDVGSKTWIVTSGNPRSSHSALDGETVDRDEPFSNGAMFPGDPALSAEERANCACMVDWS